VTAETICNSYYNFID